mgnify:FL=1
MSVEIIEDREAWDRFIDHSPYGTLFHKWDFLKIIGKYTGYRPMTYGVYEGGELACAFPLFYKVNRGIKWLFSPPPGTTVPYLGPVLSGTYDALRQHEKEPYLRGIVEKMNEHMRTVSPNYVWIQTIPGFDDIRPFMWNGYGIDVYYGYLLDITRPVKKIWDSFDVNCRKNIRASESMKFVITGSEDVDMFYDIMKKRFNDIGETTVYHHQDPGFLKDLLACYPDNVRLRFMRHEDDIMGAMVSCEYKARFISWMGSAKGNYNERMFWDFIRMAKENGFKEFENPDANNPRLLPFKTKFNPGLNYGFLLSRKDTIGKLAEWTYFNVVKRVA